MKPDDSKRQFRLTYWRIARKRCLPVLGALMMFMVAAGPALAAVDDDVDISGAIARDILIEQLESRGLAPPVASGLTFKDYIYSNAGKARYDAIVGVWLDAEGQMVPSHEWQLTHKDYCKERARTPLKATQLLRFKMHRTKEIWNGRIRYQYRVAAGMADEPGTYFPDHAHLRRQHVADFTVMQSHNPDSDLMNNPDYEGLRPPMTEAWNGLNPEISAPLSACGDLLVEHVSGNAVGEQIEFLAGYKGYYARTLEYTWDFGDGTTSQDQGKNPRHVYAREGTYKVTVTVEGNVDGKPLEQATGSVNVVIGDELALVFSSRIEQTFPGGHFLQEFQSTVPLVIGADSVFEGQAPLRSVRMENTYQDEMMENIGCSLAPRDGMLEVRAILPRSVEGATDGIDVSLTIPSDPSRPRFQSVPGVEVTCPPVAGFASMIKKVLDGMGAHWWMSFQMMHIEDLQGEGEYGFTGWRAANEPRVIARKTFNREQRLDGNQTLRESTTIEIRGGSGL